MAFRELVGGGGQVSPRLPCPCLNPPMYKERTMLPCHWFYQWFKFTSASGDTKDIQLAAKTMTLTSMPNSSTKRLLQDDRDPLSPSQYCWGVGLYPLWGRQVWCLFLSCMESGISYLESIRLETTVINLLQIEVSSTRQKCHILHISEKTSK